MTMIDRFIVVTGTVNRWVFKSRLASWIPQIIRQWIPDCCSGSRRKRGFTWSFV